MSQGAISFVVSDGPKIQADPDVRRLIRRHAMKNVALTRKIRYDSTRTKRKQITHSTTTPIESVESLEPPSRFQGSTWDIVHPIAAPALLSPYEVVRSKFNVDLNDLSMLTNFNIAMGTVSMISADPSLLISLLGQSKWSYLQFIPSRYGCSPCLTAATDCLLAQVAGILEPHRKKSSMELKLHVIALRALQEALNDTKLCVSSEVLCASQLLGLYALLKSGQSTAWSSHHRGTIDLIKHRTPRRFESEFDKALYLSHIGPITFDSILDHKPCYLSDPEWMKVYRSLACKTDVLSERSPLAISLRSHMILLPNLWHNIENVIKGEELFNPQAMNALKLRAEDMHFGMLRWIKEFNSHCIEMALKFPSEQELMMRRELYGTALECLVVVKRLLAAVDIENVRVLEKEVQSLASSILDLHKQPSPSHSWIFMAHESGVVRSILATKEDWLEPGSYSSVYQERLASRRRYVRWTEILRA